MIGLLKGMFAGADMAGTIIDKAAAGLDKLHFGDQEKAEHSYKMREQAFGVITSWLESTSGSRLARRFLAIASFLIWSGLFVLSAILNVCAIWVENSVQVTESANMVSSYANDMNPIIVTVFAFYFGGPVVMDATKNVMKNWADKSNP